MSSNPLDEAELRKKLGLRSVTTLKRWRSWGCPSIQYSKRGPHWYNFDDVQAWMKKMQLTGEKEGKDLEAAEMREHLRQGGNEEEVLGVFEERKRVKLGYEKARMRKEVALAQRYETEQKVRAGELMSRKEVEQGWLQRITTCRANLLALPGALASRLAMRDANEIHQELEAEIVRVLEEFAREPVSTRS